MTETAPKSPIVFGTDGWRARIAEDFTFENVRRCADGVARYVVGRGEQAKGVVIAYDRRFASEHFAMAAAEVHPRPRHPGRLRGPCRADPDELLRGRRARRGRGRRHHRQPQPLDRQRLQGQGADGFGRRAGHARGHRGGDRRRAADQRRPFADQGVRLVLYGSFSFVFRYCFGTKHATDILSAHPELAEMIAIWFKYQLR